MSMTASTEAYAMNRRQPRILCVDSDVAGLVLLDAILTPRGYDVLRVNTGMQIMELLEKQPFDLILLGVILPGTDGFTTCGKIRAEERFRDIPIVMMSALKSREDLIRGIEAGADDYLFKPLDHEVMLARIKMLIRRKQVRDSNYHAYQDMNTLTVISQQVVDTFNSLRFDFQTGIEKVVTLLVGKTTDMIDKPRSVMVGFMPDHVNWRWFHYEYAFQEFNRVELDFSVTAGIAAPEKGKPRMLLLSENQAAPDARILIKNMRSKNMSVENGIAYLSHDLCILSINYGQDVGDPQFQFMRHVVAQSKFLSLLSMEIQEVGKAFDYMVYALARAAEATEGDTGNHIYRVGEYCGILAERLSMKSDFIHGIQLQAMLHDVGKLYVPAHILKKTDPLSAEETIEFRKHTLWGAKIIGGSPHLHIGQSIALNHHEKWDGNGYPRGLKGEAIPVEARIAALANMYDMLRMGRRQKVPLNHATVTKILNHGDARVSPGHFDPLVLKAYRETAFLFEEVYDRRRG